MKPTAILARLKGKSPRQSGQIRVRVGMATCGISAGADKVYDAFGEAIKGAGVEGVEVVSTGCVGRCDLEPMAEVTRDDEPPVLYVRLTPEKVSRIVTEHLVGGKPVEDYTE